MLIILRWLIGLSVYTSKGLIEIFISTLNGCKGASTFQMDKRSFKTMIEAKRLC